jgi:hypothetical protein
MNTWIILLFGLLQAEVIFQGIFSYQMQLKAMRDGNGVVLINPTGNRTKIQLHLRK